MQKFSKSAISKSIGLSGGTISLPSLETTQELLEKAKSGDYSAATSIFRYYRFGATASNDEERQVVNILYDALKELFE